jgi:hypothetical protein
MNRRSFMQKFTAAVTALCATPQLPGAVSAATKTYIGKNAKLTIGRELLSTTLYVVYKDYLEAIEEVVVEAEWEPAE